MDYDVTSCDDITATMSRNENVMEHHLMHVTHYIDDSSKIGNTYGAKSLIISSSKEATLPLA